MFSRRVPDLHCTIHAFKKLMNITKWLKYDEAVINVYILSVSLQYMSMNTLGWEQTSEITNHP